MASGIEFTRKDLRNAADSGSWERGQNYYEDGLVYAVLEDGQEIIGKVQGTHRYTVRLWKEKGQVAGRCNCPYGQQEVFCKHCVAVGLAFLAGDVGEAEGVEDEEDLDEDESPSPTAARKPKAATGRTNGAPSHRRKRRAFSLDDLRKYLADQEVSSLVEIIMKQVVHDDRLRESLMLQLAGDKAGGVDKAALRRAIDSAMRPAGYVEYADAYDFSHSMREVVDSLEKLLKQGHPAEVIDLAEHALTRWEEAVDYVDDSDGYMGEVSERLAELHHEACVKARPDPEALARRLFSRETQSQWDVFHGAAETYAEVLGDKGLAAYRQLAEAAWRKAPARKPRASGYDPERWRLRSIMESLAQVSGNLEELVAIKSSDLSSAWAYLEIAETYRKARQPDKALDWAERGLKAFPEHTDARLREFLVEEYFRRGRQNEAMRLVWTGFAEMPDLSSYQHLKKHAERVSEWPKWRDKALAHIRAEAARQKKAAKRSRWGWAASHGHSVLVEIFLWEKDPEAAWREAKAGGCRSDLWLKLANLREQDHPEDALAVYRKQLKPLLEHTGDGYYEEATKLLRRIGGILKRLGRQEQFQAEIAELRDKYRRRRKFIALLDRLR